MRTKGSDSFQSAVERVLQSASRYHDRPALELHDASYTYRELAESAASIASSIIDLNDPCPYIAVMADKSFTCYAGILGIMMTGKAYLPLNPRFPAARNDYMLGKAQIRTVIAGESSDEELDNILENYSTGIYIIFPEGRKEPSETVAVTAHTPAYLLFTSGTTGKPKGVPVSNGNLAAYLDFMMNTYDFQPEDRFTQNFDLTFDLSIHDMFLAWSSGACLCVPQDNSSFAMAGFIREKKPTVWFSVPSLVLLMDRMRLLKPAAFPSIRLSFFCGEALYSKSAVAWKKAVPRSRIVNLYGPTEATIAISKYELPEDLALCKSELGIVSIGQVFAGNTSTIMGAGPLGCEGELCLTGDQVIRGYFENEAADNDAFCSDPVSGQKWYKTGDLVKSDKDGNLFFLGRRDAEVKISGYRVNLKEIENVLEEYDHVEQAVVIFEQDAEGQGILQAFIMGNKPEKIEKKQLDSFCRKRLPWYMVPGKYNFVEEIPLNMNGKVDIAALKSKYTNG
jgi:amino acid adenylation domain-containing protein